MVIIAWLIVGVGFGYILRKMYNSLKAEIKPEAKHWTYQQSTGQLLDPEGYLAGTGWAGQREGYNNPALQDKHDTGPLPQGWYTIRKPAYQHARLGPVVMNLLPDASNEMFGRGSFRIHGASDKNPEMSSEGCIIQHRDVRLAVDRSACDRLKVIA